MHDGSLLNLHQVVNFYDKGGTPNKNLDAKIKPLHLREQEKDDLVAFLKALTGDVTPVRPPEKLPRVSGRTPDPVQPTCISPSIYDKITDRWVFLPLRAGR